ncbi:MAG: hypothetical protein LW834_04405 [Cyanobium sp. 49614_E6]|jgi:hypothetical protein|nr:hypothetical protein [Cyanobium sp. 49614_E6]
MAFTAIPADGAVGFGFLVEARQAAGVQTLFLASGEHLIAPASIKLNLGFIAYHYRKSDRPIAAIHGVIDLAPYVVEWAANFSDQQADAMEGALAQLERKTLQLSDWRKQLSQAEHDALISGTFAAISGVSTVIGGAAFIADLMAGGIPWASGLWTLGSGVACGTNLGNLEAAAIRGDRCVRAINNTLFEVTEIGRTINLPATVAYETGVVQSACTGLARAFGWKNDRLRATQAGINSWLQADLRFQPA